MRGRRFWGEPELEGMYRVVSGGRFWGRTWEGPAAEQGPEGAKVGSVMWSPAGWVTDHLVVAALLLGGHGELVPDVHPARSDRCADRRSLPQLVL
jgi:hypothetical protein